VRELAQRFITERDQTIMDLMKVSGEQQVMLKVRIMEVARANLREYGIYPRYQPDNGGNEGRFLSDIGAGLVAPTPFATGSLFFDDNGGFGPLGLTLQAMQQKGLINVLAEPNLTAITGETAGFLAGGEFPIPSGRDNQGNVIIEFKKFGVSLNFTPRVLSKDRISLLLDTEVSSLDKDRGLTLESVDIPGLSVRRAQTTVEIGSGGTIMIAGLIQSRTTQGLNGLPGASELPIIGELFKSKSFNRDESEVLIVVTPFLVKPYAKNFAEYNPSASSQGLTIVEPSATNLSAIQPSAQPTPLDQALADITPTAQNMSEATAAPAPKISTANHNAKRPARFNAFGEERMAGMHFAQKEKIKPQDAEVIPVVSEMKTPAIADAVLTHTFIPTAKPKGAAVVMSMTEAPAATFSRTALPVQKPLAMSRFNQKMVSALYKKHDQILPAKSPIAMRGGYIFE
jgi:hypothetical protein